MRSFVRGKAWGLLACIVMLAGCGETFRISVNPEPKPGGDPQAQKNAIVLTQGAPGMQGAATHINVSGDSIVSQVALGVDPVAGTFLGGASNQIYVANQGQPSVSEYLTFFSLGATPLTISIPPGPPVPGMTAIFSPSNQVVYAALGTGNSIAVINPITQLFAGEQAVGTQPVAITGSFDGSRIFVVNKGSNDVTVVSTADTSVLGTIAVGSSPIAAVLGTDSQIYVLNSGDGTVTPVDPVALTAGTPITVGSSPTSIAVDVKNNRVLVTNGGDGTLSIIEANSAIPATYRSVTNVTVGTTPQSVTALSDGSRYYVANSGSGNVTVVNALSKTKKADIALPQVTVGGAATTPQPWVIGSNGDLNKVIVACRGTNSAATIRTTDETVTATLNLPGTPTYILVTP